MITKVGEAKRCEAKAALAVRHRFQACYESFQAEFAWLQKAIEKGLVQLLCFIIFLT